MSMDLAGINNINEYYTNHYFASIFAENAEETISAWRAKSKESDEYRTPWARLRDCSRQYYVYHDKEQRGRSDAQIPAMVKNMADMFLAALDYPEATPRIEQINDALSAPVYLEITKTNGAPLLWVILAQNTEDEPAILDGYAISAPVGDEENVVSAFYAELDNEELATKILFAMDEPPRWLIFIGLHQIALIDRNKWNEKRYLSFDLADIFARHEESTLQAMAVLLHKDNLCPAEGGSLLDQLDENSHRHASGVSQDLKYALRESIELLGNEVLYDLSHRQGRNLDENPVDAGELTIQCMRYMYRMLFMLFIEARPELGYAPMKAQAYVLGYSLESLRDVADSVREETSAVGDGYYLHETLSKLYDLIYSGYPSTEEELHKLQESDSLNDVFIIEPLKAHIFDPEMTPLITAAKLRNSVMLRIIDLMSVSRPSGRRNDRRGRISYSTLGINQMGAVYEALLSYRGFIAEDDLYEVKRAGDQFNPLDVGYFIKEHELDQYTEEERVRVDERNPSSALRMYKKGTFVYRLAGREREKSASYYTPEVLTKCLVKYALKELLEGKTADEILQLTICEPAMGSAAFLNEAINQLAEAYIDRKQKELGETISYEKRFTEIQKVKMYLADRNVYGIDLNPVAVELAEVSLWLNTIFEGGFVPWFSTQLINGNSLIGARRQCYRIEQAQTTVKGMRWYENAPERLPFDATRADKGYKFGRKQIYHFLLGDPGMCSYSDKVIKSLEPDNIKKMAAWNKKFTAPIDDDDVVTLLRLSTVIDELWDAQIKLRKEIEAKTQDNLSIYGHRDNAIDSHTTIRQKDKIYSELYKSEHMRNAGPYARLKFAMDYWCALWFWPIDKADLLPSRSEFLFDMSLILEGTMAAVNVKDDVKGGQLSMFPTEMEQMAMDIIDTYGTNTVVDIPRLRKENPRLDLAAQIAEQNKFMHWELEFAELFAEHGGFDLVIGNPPWVKVTWEEKGVLSDKNPMFAVRNLTAAQTLQHRSEALHNKTTSLAYFGEYTFMAGEQSFLNAHQNYADLIGQQTNLYKCFLPQAWSFGSKNGISAFVHPDGVFDDPRGGTLREVLYPKLRKHFKFSNKFLLFADVSTSREFSLNIYSNVENQGFDCINNLFTPDTVDQCYDAASPYKLYGLKDDKNEWCKTGHPQRIINVGKKELLLFANLFDDSDNWKQARLPVLHAQPLINVLRCFAQQSNKLSKYESEIYTTEFWHEANSQRNNIIRRDVHFPLGLIDLITSGAHIGVANPLFKSSKADCNSRYDFDTVDLTSIPDSYLQRCNYTPACEISEYFRQIPVTGWGEPITKYYKVTARKMLNLPGNRTLMGAITLPQAAHINGLTSVVFMDNQKLVLYAAGVSSIVFDFIIKLWGKQNLNSEALELFPVLGEQNPDLLVRSLMLNCVNSYYSELWNSMWSQSFRELQWSRKNIRLDDKVFSNLSEKWTHNTALRTDYERRQALVEIDVLIAMLMGMTLNDLIAIYRIYFPVLIQNESDTWYDSNGRIVFTTDTTLTGVGVDRAQFENEMKNAPVGEKFYKDVIDDTLPGGPIKRTVEYVAPFDRCDREKDYETAWKYFEDKYGGNK